MKTRDEVTQLVAKNMTNMRLFSMFFTESFSDKKPLQALVAVSAQDIIHKALFPESINEIDYMEAIDILQARWEDFLYEYFMRPDAPQKQGITPDPSITPPAYAFLTEGYDPNRNEAREM